MQRSRSIRLVLVASALAFALAVPAATIAGKSTGGSAPFIALASVSDGALAAAQPKLGASVKFSTGYPTGTKNPWISLRCYQDGSLVYAQGGTPSETFTLGGGSSVWLDLGGSAACSAELGDLYWRGGKQYYTPLAQTGFDAGA